MAVVAAKVSVGTTPTALWELADADYHSAMVKPVGGDVSIGGSGVDTTDGFPVLDGSHLSFDASPNEVLYAVCAAGTVDVFTFRTGVG